MTETTPQAPIVRPQELTRLLADLHEVKPWPGVRRSAITLVLLLAGYFWAMNISDPTLFIAVGLATAMLFTSIAVTTHDAIHHTLTGIKSVDEILPRLLSWPVLWPHGLYAELHKIHHKMNGQDTEDPERSQWTQEEYDRASALGKWAARNQLWLSVFVYGGFGFIISHVMQGMKFAQRSKAVRRQMMYDLAGILFLNTVVYAWMAALDLTWKYFMFYLVVERVGGGALQFRALMEHYGLWGKRANYFETQIFNCRNIKTNEVGSWLFNRLNFHSVHHAFPTIPFYNLGKAHARIRQLYLERGVKLVEDEGYLRTFFKLARNPRLIVNGHSSQAA